MKNSFLVFILFMSFAGASAVYAEEPMVKSPHYAKAIELLQKEQYDQAIELFQKAIQDETDPIVQSRIYNLIGLAFLKQGTSISSSLGSFEQAIRLDPQYAEAYFNAASAYAGEAKDATKAVAYFKKTIEVDPDFSKAYFGLGWFSLTESQDPEQALIYFQKTVDAYKDFAEAYYGLGLSYIQLRKPHMALGAVSKLREIQRDDLAAVLEKTIAEVSAPPEAEPAPMIGEQVGEAPAQGGGKSPFGAMQKGKKG